MYFTTASLIALLATSAIAVPVAEPRQAKGCFIVGTSTLPAESQTAADGLASKITCDTTNMILGGKIPDMTSGGVSFSQIDFSKSSDSPVGFGLKTFATTEPLKDNDKAKFEAMGSVYTAAELALRSIGDSKTLAQLKGPKFFLAFQNQRIATAQGNPPTAAGQQVDHLLGKVLKNAPGATQAEKDQVTALAKQLA